MKTTISIIENCVSVIGISIAVATRFMWMPGIRPVMVPARTPIKSGRIKFNIRFEDCFCY